MNRLEFLSNSGNDESASFEENQSEQLKGLLEDYFFDSQGKFDYKDLQKLAKLQKGNRAKRNNWTRDNEIKRCSLMKELETHLLKKDEREVEKFWERNENEYSAYYGRSDRGESSASFETLKHGVLNEIIANKILNKLSEFQFEMTTSEMDIDHKIDIIGFSNDNKTILAIQVKQGSRYTQEKTQEVREINKLQGNNKEENAFFGGCSHLKNELELGDKDIILKNLWITIPAKEKIGEGGECSYRLQKSIVENIQKILEQEN